MHACMPSAYPIDNDDADMMLASRFRYEDGFVLRVGVAPA